MPKNKLFEEDSEEDVTIKTENEYAKKYDAWREKEERHKLEQKYGSKALDSDASVSSDSEDESDEPLEVSEETEAQFLKTLSLLKTKDPRIYDPTYKFFNERAETEKEKENETKKVVFADSDDDDEDDGNIFRIEKKAEINEPTQDTKKVEKLKDYLTGKAEHVEEDDEKDLAPLKALWSDPKLNEGEAFLRDYILNKRYLEEGDAGEAEDRIRDDADLEADEELVEEQGKFERAYNFRFEEPDDEYLKRFPRTMNYIRPKDDRRSKKRAEVRERKEAEKRSKMEEIARLKALKLKEVREKIVKLKEVTGNQDLAFNDEDIEGDFDPEEHDKRMKAIFDEQYYGEADEQKPVFPDLDEELEIENWENYEDAPGNDDGPHCEDEDFNMDADYDPKKARENLLEQLKRNMGNKRRNRKKKSKLADLLAEEKPKFIPEKEKSYAEFMEEYYKMDCEDVIGGDLPTRFKYREVLPNDYGLSIEEILLADDKELTQWVPLKKIVKHRPPNAEKSEVKTYAMKAADVQLKKKVLPSLFKDLPQEPELVVPAEESKKKKKKKKKAKSKDEIDTQYNEDVKENKNGTNDINNTKGVSNTEVKSKNKEKKELLNDNIGKENLIDDIQETTKDKLNSNPEVKSKKKSRKDSVNNDTLNESYDSIVHGIVPPVLIIMCKSSNVKNYDTSSLEIVYSGGATLSLAVIKEVKAKFPNIKHVLQGYGMTEATGALTGELETECKEGSVGKILKGTIVKVVDIDTRKLLGPGQPGEVCVKGPALFNGYIGKDLKEDTDEEGFYKTGDVAYYDNDGFFYIVDRIKEIIKYKGWQVPPSELEDLILQHPAVKDVGVTGRPDAFAGELPTAFIVKKPDMNVTEAEIIDFVDKRVTTRKRLHGGVIFVEEVPKNGSGKILRRKLREMLPKLPTSKL